MRANAGKQPKILEGVRDEFKTRLNLGLMLFSYKIILPCLTMCLVNKNSGYVPVMLSGVFFVKQGEGCVMNIFQLDGDVAVSCSAILKVKEHKVLRIYIKLSNNWYGI